MKRSGLLLLALLASACGGKDVCDRVSPCKKDPAQTAEDRKACKATEAAAQSSLCFSETTTYAQCFNDNVVCGADDTTDTAATTSKARTLCASQLAAFTTCCQKNTAAVACN